MDIYLLNELNKFSIWITMSFCAAQQHEIGVLCPAYNVFNFSIRQAQEI